MNVLNRRGLTRSLALLVSSALMAGGALVGAGTASASPATTVSGTVRDQAGAKADVSVDLNGGTIDADGNLHWEDWASVTLDAAGNFSIDAATALDATYPNHWLEFSGENRVQVNGLWYGAGAKVPVTLGSTVTAVVAQRAALDQDINVTVTGVPTNTWARLYVWENGTGWRSLGSDYTDAAGKLEFRGYKNGRYTVRIDSTPTSYYQYIGGLESLPENGTAVGTFGTAGEAIATFSFAPVNYGSAVGLATWAGPTPTDAYAELLRWYDNGDGTGVWREDDRTKIAAGGSFRFDELMPGETYSTAVYSRNTDGTMTHVTTYRGGSTVPPVEKADITSVVATAGATSDLGIIAVSTIAGRANIELNGFLAGKQISLYAYNITKGYSEWEQYETSKKLYAASGAKVLEGLEPGTYRISAVQGTEGSAKYYAEALNVVVASGNTTTVALTATPGVFDTGNAKLVTKIDGAVRVGETVSARTVLTKAPAAFASAVKYQFVWTDGKQILGTAQTLKLTPAMTAKSTNIRVWVHASAPGYMSLEEGAYLGSDKPVVDPGLRPVPTKAPSISGKVGFGKKLTANPGKWSPAPTSFTYQWLRNGAVIKGATAKTYKPRRADAGKRISVRVTPVLAGHDSLAVTSPRTTALPKVAGKVTAKLAKKAIKAKSKAKVTVTVKSKGISPITGKVTVKAGNKSKTVTLKASKKGKVTVTLPKLKKGTYKLKVTYKGNSQVKKSTLKKTLTLKVK